MNIIRITLFKYKSQKAYSYFASKFVGTKKNACKSSRDLDQFIFISAFKMDTDMDNNNDGTKQFIQMSKAELVDHLGARGINTTGSKLALVGRAFVAWETGIQVKFSTETYQKKTNK